MKVEPCCSPETPGVQLREERWQTMKRTAPHPSLEEQCSLQKGHLPGGSGMHDSCFRTCWGPAQQPRTQEGPGLSLELIPDATLPAVHLSPLTTEFTFTYSILPIYPYDRVYRQDGMQRQGLITHLGKEPAQSQVVLIEAITNLGHSLQPGDLCTYPGESCRYQRWACSQVLLESGEWRTGQEEWNTVAWGVSGPWE